MAWRALTAGLVSVLLLAGCGDSGSGDADADVDGDADTDADADTDTDTDTTPFCDEITCGAATLCAVPADPAARGPWTVGARTADVGGLTTEVWYPAAFGSEAGQSTTRYDIRLALPGSEQDKIPDADNPWQDCDCYRDLPIDDTRGPYPVIVFVHGLAAFRTQSLQQMVHYASRGFIVLSQDHPGLWLADMLELNMDGYPTANTEALLAALAAPAGDLAFLAERIDLTRIGMVGHSAGGGAITGFGGTPGVRAIIPMASRGVEAGDVLEQVLVLGGLDDAVVAYAEQQAGYEASPTPRRLVGLGNAGHLAFSDLCALTNPRGQDIVEIAIEYEIKNATMASMLWDGCEDDDLAPAAGWAVVNHTTTAVLEEVLRCGDAAPAFAGLEAAFPAVAEFREDL